MALFTTDNFMYLQQSYIIFMKNNYKTKGFVKSKSSARYLDEVKQKTNNSRHEQIIEQFHLDQPHHITQAKYDLLSISQSDFPLVNQKQKKKLKTLQPSQRKRYKIEQKQEKLFDKQLQFQGWNQPIKAHSSDKYSTGQCRKKINPQYQNIEFNKSLIKSTPEEKQEKIKSYPIEPEIINDNITIDYDYIKNKRNKRMNLKSAFDLKSLSNSANLGSLRTSVEKKKLNQTFLSQFTEKNKIHKIVNIQANFKDYPKLQVDKKLSFGTTKKVWNSSSLRKTMNYPRSAYSNKRHNNSHFSLSYTRNEKSLSLSLVKQKKFVSEHENLKIQKQVICNRNSMKFDEEPFNLNCKQLINPKNTSENMSRSLIIKKQHKKQQKKQNSKDCSIWIKTGLKNKKSQKANIQNFYKLDTNSPLQKDINKIVSLIQQEDRLYKNMYY